MDESDVRNLLEEVNRAGILHIHQGNADLMPVIRYCTGKRLIYYCNGGGYTLDAKGRDLLTGKLSWDVLFPQPVTIHNSGIYVAGNVNHSELSQRKRSDTRGRKTPAIEKLYWIAGILGGLGVIYEILHNAQLIKF